MLIQCKVSYRKNILLLQYNKEMYIVGLHSALDPSNYGIIANGLLKILPNDTIAEATNNKDIRLIIPYDYANYINSTNYISIGYVGRKEIKCIKSYDDYIYNVCDNSPLGDEVPEFNLLEGYGVLQNEDFIFYTHTGKNELDQIYSLDFYATANGVIKHPYEILKISDTELLFKFIPGTFTNSSDIYLGVTSLPKTIDIYGLPIKGDVYLNIATQAKPALKTLSLSNIDNTIENRAYLMLLFDDRIKDFYANDFAVLYNGNTYPIVYEGNVYFNRTVFEVWVDLKTTLVFPLNPITLFTNVPSIEIKTINFENNPIKPIAGMMAYTFYSNYLEWKLSDKNNLSSTEISINFNTFIDYGTLITNSTFTASASPWDGSDIEIPSGAISFQALGNTSIMTLNFNPSFGSITINSDPYNTRKFISNNITNSQPALLTSAGNNLIISFSQLENSEAYPMSIDTFSYKGSTFIMSENENFLCYGYEPNGIFIFKDYIVVPPLTSINDNPFTGGTLNTSYLLEVDNNHDYRIYGDSLNKTTINGFLRVSGSLTFGKDVTLQNLDILGTLYIKIGDGNIILDTITSENIVYE